MLKPFNHLLTNVLGMSEKGGLLQVLVSTYEKSTRQAAAGTWEESGKHAITRATSLREPGSKGQRMMFHHVSMCSPQAKIVI